tara:strand:- start:76 stop:558 length:483 start_codon:yes stop_codon:yes gene_type:complete
MLINKWKSDGRDAVSKWIPSKNYKKFKPITQVYGVCFNKKGEVLIIKDEGKKEWKLPGGTPEKNEMPEETLKREVMEESTVVLGDCSMIGVQETEIEGKKEYQLRYVAVIEEVKKHTIDPSTNKWVERKFIDAKDFEKYIKWGGIGKEIIRLAQEWFEKR